MGIEIGANTALTLTATELLQGKGFGLGDKYEDSDGKVWVYVKATATIAQYDVVTYDPATYSTTVAPISTANDARGNPVGVAAIGFASADYGWLQIFGPCTMNVLASCAANTLLNTTATGGSPDDDGTSGAFTLLSIFLTTARAASPGSAPGYLNYPIVGAVI